MRPYRRTLRSRIIWSTTLVTAIAVVAMVGTVVLVVIALTEARVESALSDRFAAVESTLSVDRNGHITQAETSADRIEDSAWVFDLSGNQVIGPSAGKHVYATVRSLSQVTKRTHVHRGEHLYLAAPFKDENSRKTLAVVVTAESYEPYEATQTAVIIGLIALGIAVIAGTSAITAWTIGRTLDPVNAMATSAEDWSERNLESRFDPGSSDNEIAHLGRTLNVLLDRVATTIRGEQLLTSELAHELRTPLTAIRGEAELGLMKSRDQETSERLDRVVELVDRMSATITTLVSMARGHSAIGQRSNVASALASTVSDLQVPDTITLETRGVDASLEAATTTEMIERILAPILDNAVRHAATSVTVKASCVDRVVRIDIIDDGRGVTIDEPDDVFRAGARSSTSEGAGLGLALALRVARMIGGDIELTSAAEPTTFRVEIPAF
ncbi:MAG: ATP-binding protein [Aeromicrobium sp.]